MSTYVINGFQEVSFDDFFGEVKGIEVDNVYDTQVFNRAVEKINNEKIEFFLSNDYDLTILKHCPTIRYIAISGEADLSILYDLPTIEGVKIGWLFGDNEKFDFSRLTNLRQLQIPYTKKNKSLFQLPNLSRLCIREYKEKDLQQLQAFVGVQDLIISMSTLNSLQGIENMPFLQKLTLDYCLRLKDVSNLTELKKLKELCISDCNKIEQLESTLSQLTSLEKLVLWSLETKGGVLQNLDFVHDMKSLNEMDCSWRVKKRNEESIKRLTKVKFI